MKDEATEGQHNDLEMISNPDKWPFKYLPMRIIPDTIPVVMSFLPIKKISLQGGMPHCATLVFWAGVYYFVDKSVGYCFTADEMQPTSPLTIVGEGWLVD